MRLLLIDDDDMVSLTFREYLERGGCVVDSARDLAGALRCLAEHVYSTIWLDLQLTGTSTAQCLAFLEAMKRSARGARIVAVSGFASRGMEQQATDAGADWFVRKPFDARSVAAMLT